MQKIKFTFMLVACLHTGIMLHSQPGTVAQQQMIPQLDSFIQKLLEKIPVIPAIAITVVNENGPVFTKGYGWADKEAGIKADENTLFYIASSTKSFTALVAALLDQEKKIFLDTSFKKYFKTARFKNEIGNDVTIRTLLTHTSGIENSPLAFRMAYSGDIEKKEMLRILTDATVTKAKPGVYDYDNLGYNIYGMALEEQLQKKWQDLLQEKIFTPLGMKRTTAYISLAKKNKWPVAAPYNGYGEKGLTRVYLEKQDNTMQSAGGLVTTASDIAQWLQAQIHDGKIKAKQVFPEQVMKATHTGFASYEKAGNPFTGPGEYGLGWSMGKYNNEKIIYHFGGYPGFKSHISFMPDKKTGVAVFVNEGGIGGVAADMVATYVYDWVTGMADIEILYDKKLEELESNHKKAMESTQRSYADRAKRVWQLSLPLESYTGKYRHPYFGDMEVGIENNTLTVKFGNMHVVSTPFTEKETIRVELIPGTGQVVSFKTDETKKVNSLVYDRQEYKRTQ